jgi:hypothetical protein
MILEIYLRLTDNMGISWKIKNKKPRVFLLKGHCQKIGAIQQFVRFSDMFGSWMGKWVFRTNWLGYEMLKKKKRNVHFLK